MDTSAKPLPGNTPLAAALLSSSLTDALRAAPDAPEDTEARNHHIESLALPETGFSSESHRLPAIPNVSETGLLTEASPRLKMPRKRKKVIFCKFPECMRYAREKGFCIKHGGGKVCTKKGCPTRCYALGFCFKHGNETYNRLEFEETQALKKAKCMKCEKKFHVPACFFSTVGSIKCQKTVNPKDSKAFCPIHARQLLLALKEQSVKSGAYLDVDLNTYEVPNMADTKNLRKATCYSNKRKLCDIAGCKSLARKLGKCQKHATKIDCSVEGCAGKAQARGLCGHHGGGKRCKHTKCFKVAVLGNNFCSLHSDLEGMDRN